ncbi:MAG: ABC transporter ATP-binding protein [Actinobacteria bacterium]|nr:MAG: ABC transporter ATP-binding protein [Actinomycetota bacterium]
MISATALTRRFGGREVVRDVSFSVAPGEVVGFLGPNGAGKTTTMRMLLGLLRPSGGEGRIDGRVGYLPEAFTAYDAVSVRSYLRFMCRMKGVSIGDVDRAMELAGVGKLGRRPFGRLSKGQRQRVGLAQALLGRPGAYVLDEATIGLDPRQVVDARGLIRSLADDDRAAVLVSTHLLAEASAVCDRVVVIAAGRVVAEERPGAAGDLEARFLRLVGEAELT